MPSQQVLQETDIQQIVQAARPGLRLESWHLKPLSDLGFLGQSMRLTAVLTDKLGAEHTLQAYVKMAPSKDNQFHYELVDSMGVFMKEPVIYKVLGEMQTVLPEPVAPAMYLATPEEVLVLEDLSVEAFSNKSGPAPLDLDHCRVALATLARLHAASVIYERKKGTTLDNIIPHALFEVLYLTDPKTPGSKWLKAGVVFTRQMIEKYFSSYPSTVVERAIQLIKDLPVSVQKTKYPKVLSHCDLWNNNVMYKYDQDGKPIAARIIDYQLAKYSTPALDVNHFLYTNTTREFRSQNYDQLLAHYYAQLSDYLRDGGLNPNSFLTWAEFSGAIQEFRPTILAMMNLVNHLVQLPSDALTQFVKCEEDYRRIWSGDRTHVVFPLLDSNTNYFNMVYHSTAELLDYVSIQMAKTK